MYHTGEACPNERGSPTRMQYDHYPDLIARKFSILLEKWPLPEFIAPGNMNSLSNLRLLFNAFDRDITQFRALTDAEWKAWGEAYDAGEAPPGVTHCTIAAPLPNGTPAPSDSTTPASTTASPSAEPSGATETAPNTASEQARVDEGAAPLPVAFQFVDAQTPSTAAALQVKKRVRKTRSDKGTTRRARVLPHPQAAEAEGVAFVMN